MELTFLGGAREVGASCTLLQVADHRLLIDGGMRPAARLGQPRLPDLALLSTPPEALIITHAHIDHTGGLPLIASLYPHMPIYATESTRVLTEILLRDSVRIMESEGLRPDGETPLYNSEQVDAFLGRIQPIAMHVPFAPLPHFPALTVRYLHAGHILGAAMLYFETPEGSLLHTGDISVTDQRTIKGLDVLHLPQADVMICEGTYGNRSHSSRKEEEGKLAETIQRVLTRGGRVICPAFAVGRSQEIVLILKSYRASGKVSPVPIYLDGMVRSVCNAYQLQSHDLHPNLQRYLLNARRPLFADPDLHIFSVRSTERPVLIKRNIPMVIISSSGMLSGGASPLYAAEAALHEKDCIIFSGYQDEESPGAAMLNARQGETLRMGDQFVTLNCEVAKYNLSGHADAEQIIHVVTRVNPKRLILVHGAPEALESLARRFNKLTVDLPASGETLTIHPRQTAISSTASPTTSTILPPVEELTPPTISQLWKVAITQGPTRPWTSVELGQHYYGSSYRPAFRSQVERVLREAAPYFKQGRVGAQPTYTPRPLQETEQLRPVSELTAGEIVLVQGQKGAQPGIALLLASPLDGSVLLVSDQWKAGNRPINLIQLLPHIRREDLLSLSQEENKQQLTAWRKEIEKIWIDLFALWNEQQEKPFTFDTLCQRISDPEQRLAWGLELLSHGQELFVREGNTWTPLPEHRVSTNAGFAHHLKLLRAGPGATVSINGRQGRLNGKSSWRLFEVSMEEAENKELTVHVRANSIQI